MKNTRAKLQYRWLIPVGLMINSTALLLSHYMHMPDFAMGSMQGVGIGVMLSAFIKNRKVLRKAM